MNSQFKLLALFALVCVGALAMPLEPEENPFPDEEMSQLALIPSDSDEVSSLKDPLFSDFCIDARDEVKAYLKSSVNGAAAKIFNLMFNTISDISEDVVNIGRKSVDEGVELIKSNSVQNEPKVQDAESKEEIEQDIQENVEQLQKKSLLAVVTGAVRTVINAVIEAVSSETAKRLALLRVSFNGENLKDKITEACTSISFELKSALDHKLAEAKRELSRSPRAAEMAEQISRARVENVGCITTGRVSKVARFCDVLKMAGPTIFPMLGL